MASSAVDSVNTTPWVLTDDRPYVDEEYPIVFGSCEAGIYFIDNSKKTKDLNVISLSICGGY